MVAIFDRKLKVDMYSVIWVLEVIAVLVMAVMFWYCKNEKLSNILSGFITGLAIAIIQMMFAKHDHDTIKALRSIGVKRVLPYRDDEVFYRTLIYNSKRNVDVLGSTAYRFLKDFADDSRPDKQELLRALLRKVKVRILLPDIDYLYTEEDRHKSEMSSKILHRLAGQYPGYFEFRYYRHIPTHSLVIVDDECLAGPISPNVSSKDTPAIYSDKNSVYVSPYLEYFEHEWESATEPKP